MSQKAMANALAKAAGALDFVLAEVISAGCRDDLRPRVGPRGPRFRSTPSELFQVL